MEPKIKEAQKWFLNQKSHQTPLLIKRKTELEQQLKEIEINKQPRYQTIKAKSRLINELNYITREIQKYNNEQLYCTFVSESAELIQQHKDLHEDLLTDEPLPSRKKRKRDLESKIDLIEHSYVDTDNIDDDDECVHDDDDDDFNEYIKNDKYQQLLNQLNLQDEFDNTHDEDINKKKYFCRKCNQPLLTLSACSKLVCSNCSLTQDFVDVNATNTFNVEPDTQNNYQRSTHLMEILEPFRDTKPIDIDPQVFDDLKKLYSQNRYGFTRYINFAKVNQYLQHLGYKHLYKHKHQITMKINGQEWPKIHEDEEWKVVFLFLRTNSVYEQIKNEIGAFGFNDSQRSSYLKYELSVYHIMKMLGLNQFLPYLKLLQVPQRHRTQLDLFQKVCKAMGIDYVPNLR